MYYFFVDISQVGSERHAKTETNITTNTFDEVEPTNNVSEPLFPENCGLRSDDQFSLSDDVHFRVVKGSTAKPGEYPWQVCI